MVDDGFINQLSNYLNGVAAFKKKDKVILLPVKWISRSPSNIRFRITSSQFCDPYLIVLIGEIFGRRNEPPIIPDAVLPANLSHDIDIQRVMGGKLIWPRIGWEVFLLHGVVHCSDLSYVDPIIPLPLHACVNSNVLREVLLCSARSSCFLVNQTHGILRQTNMTH